MKNFNPEKIYIISNKHPKDWYPNVNENLQKALIRRIKGKCTEFKLAYKVEDEVLDWSVI